jgi:3-oxoacyl-(acyl-carrier-protein) synthase
LKDTQVVVTGMGVVSPIGSNIGDFWKNCCEGNSGVRTITEFDIPNNQSRIAGIVDDFEQIEPLLGMSLASLDRNCAFALVAAREALRRANLCGSQLLNVDPERVGVFLATAIGQMASMERAVHGWQSNTEATSDEPQALFHFNTAARLVAHYFGLRGGYVTLMTGCTGAVDSIGYAIDAIRAGEVDVAVTGGTEAPISPLVVAAFGKIGATSKRNDDPAKASRPFDSGRDGFVLAEGCGILVLESLAHAQSRNAPILAVVSGYGSINNCYHMTGIPEDGLHLARSAQLALADAQLDADVVDALNAHGSSTPQNDLAESNAYWQLFAERTSSIPVTCIKSHLGHPLAASSSIELIASILSMLTATIPPTINVEQLDPRCRLDLVTNSARHAPTRCTLKTSSGFAGVHSSIVVQKYEEALSG